MHFQQVRAFRLAAELGSFSKAAEELFLSQPAVSLQVRHLEQELGVELFVREGKRIRLTESGKIFLKFARQMDHLFHDVSRELAETRPGAKTIRIGCGPGAARYVLPPLLARLHEHQPDLRVEISVLPLPQVSNRLAHGDIDIAVLTRPFLSDESETNYLLTERLFLAAPTGHPLTRPSCATPEKIAQQPFVALPAASDEVLLLQKWAADHGVSLRITLEVNSQDALGEAVHQGLGIALLPEPTLAEQVALGHLGVIPAPGMPIEHTLYVANRAGCRIGAALRDFLATARQSEWQRAIPSLNGAAAPIPA